ncbi:hypothetical protein O181_007130 [Austropuccinia psidii MF-1]|uniref:Uncharacterized protein n=1 Tax=Austropuccinia psidii MF-1 TaxID=1389203 RepID=A0A9Q3BMB9_9BASI|nr:hypothetical protein [Austropuccinia psidii MF-1]
MPSTPRDFQPVLFTIPYSNPPPSPSSSTSRTAFILTVRLSPMVTSPQLQPVASSSRRREVFSPLLFCAAQSFQERECWPIPVTREDSDMVSEGQDSVARLFIRVDRNSREVIMCAKDRNIPGTSSEEMASKLVLYEDELINGFQRTSDDLGKNN